MAAGWVCLGLREGRQLLGPCWWSCGWREAVWPHWLWSAQWQREGLALPSECCRPGREVMGTFPRTPSPGNSTIHLVRPLKDHFPSFGAC